MRNINKWMIILGCMSERLANECDQISSMNELILNVKRIWCYWNRNEVAYSSTDKMCYIRKFSTNGVDMVLLNTLQGHEADVTCVKWNHVLDKWVTGSEDATIRVWVRNTSHFCQFLCIFCLWFSSLLYYDMFGSL